MRRIVVHTALMSGAALLLMACGWADSRSPVPEFMRIKGSEPPPPETPPDVKSLVRGKMDFVGKRSLTRPDMLRNDRRQLVGLLTADPKIPLEEGAQLTLPHSQGQLFAKYHIPVCLVDQETDTLFFGKTSQRSDLFLR